MEKKMKKIVAITLICALSTPSVLLGAWTHSVGATGVVPNNQDIAFTGTGANNAAWIAKLHKVRTVRGFQMRTYLEQDTGSTTAIGEFSGEYKLSDATLTQWEGAARHGWTLESVISRNFTNVHTLDFDTDLE